MNFSKVTHLPGSVDLNLACLSCKITCDSIGRFSDIPTLTNHNPCMALVNVKLQEHVEIRDPYTPPLPDEPYALMNAHKRDLYSTGVA